jgi:lysophospholipase L1-like esterase
MRKLLCVLIVVVLASFRQEPKVAVYLIGDSTMANKEVKAYPEHGWGMPFANFFNSSVVVDNRAQNGRSTRTFLEENRWAPVVEKLKQGDYVFIQFGHNDEVSTKKSYTTEAQFRANLTRYVNETRSKKASPVLITPVARRNFDASGKLAGTHEVYSAIVRSVAADLNVPLIDLDRKSQELLSRMGPENSKFLFNHLAPGEHPNYPDGKEDNTHFSEFGARKMAELVLKEIRNQHLGLETMIVNYKK